MIKIEHTEVVGWEHAIRGARNPMNSWAKSDSYWTHIEDAQTQETAKYEFFVGENDLKLMRQLCAAGSDHRKFMRMIAVYADIAAMRAWWAEYDTYKIGTVANSCSTMHKIHAKEFTLSDFSCEHIGDVPNCDPAYCHALEGVIMALNEARRCYLDTKDKRYWWQMIELLPQSYNQRRTVMLNYEVLRNMYHARKNHKLDDWHAFCRWVESLPYAKELILGE